MKCGILALIIATLLAATFDVTSADSSLQQNEAQLNNNEERDLGNKKARQNRKKNKRNKNKKNKKNKKVYHPPTWPAPEYPAPTWPVFPDPNWPYWKNPTAKPTPKPTRTPTRKPTPKPTAWIGGCYLDYNLQFFDDDGQFIDAIPGGAATLGDYYVFSGDLWQKGSHYPIGFFEAVKYVMNPIDMQSVFLVIGSIQLKDFGQITFSGYERNKDSVPMTSLKGPVQTLAITGGTGAFVGASGLLTCQEIQETTNMVDTQFLNIIIKPKCPQYPAPKPTWP